MPFISHPVQRRVTIFASVSMVVLAGVMTALSASLLEIAATFDIAPTRAGILYSIHFIGFMIVVAGSLLFSGLRARIIAAKLFAFLYVPALLLAAISGNLTVLGAALLLAGAAGGILESHTSSIQVATAHDEAEAGAMVSVAQMFFAVGALAVPVYLALTARRPESWRSLLAILAAVAAAAAITGTTVRFRDFDGGKARAEFRTQRRASALLPIIIGIALYVGAEVTLFGWAPTILEHYHGVPTTRARLAPSLFWIGMLGGRSIIATVARHVEPTRLLRFSATGAIVSSILFSVFSAEFLSWLSLLAAALGCAGIWPLIVASSGEVDSDRGTIITVGAGSVGATLFPYVAGRTAELLPGKLIPLTVVPLLLGVLLLNGRRRT